MRLNTLFTIHTAKSRGFESHKQGDIPFVSNGFQNNGVVGFVKPLSKEKVFNEDGLCVSAFCEVTVQKAPFLPRGNGGSGLTVLIPKKQMSTDELHWYASLINNSNWRFSYGRMVIKDRIKDFILTPLPDNFKLPVDMESLIPQDTGKTRNTDISFGYEPVKKYFEVNRGKGRYFEECKPGKTPLVSASSSDNGLIGFVDLEPTFNAPAITVERVSGNAFVQLEDFATVPDDIFVLQPKEELSLEEWFYLAIVLNQQKWRFDYSRKVTPERIKKLKIPIPSKNNKTDIKLIKKAINQAYGWDKIIS